MMGDVSPLRQGPELSLGEEVLWQGCAAPAVRWSQLLVPGHPWRWAYPAAQNLSHPTGSTLSSRKEMKSGERGCSLNPKVTPSSQVDGRAADFTPSCAATTFPTPVWL